MTKAINVGVLLLAFSAPLRILLGPGSARTKSILISSGASAGFSQGSFNQAAAIEFYGPMLAAIVLKKAVSMVRKTARV